MSRDDWDGDADEGGQSDSVIEDPASSTNVEGPGIRTEVIEMVKGTKERKRIDGKAWGVKTEAPRITPKMRAFASLVAQGNSPREAYRKAYAVRSNTAESTVIASANKLMQDQRISGLMEPIWESIKQNVIDDAIATRRHVLEQLHAHASDTNVRTGDRLKALELMGKAIGMFVDKSEAKVEQVDPEQLKRELDSHLKAFKLKAVGST
jgi:DNA primase large subunit